LVAPASETFFATVRDFYEAYAIYTFYAFLIAVLEDEKGPKELIEKLAEQLIQERQAVEVAVINKTAKPSVHIKPACPCCYVHHKPTSVAAAWLYQCKLMVMQFVILKPIMTLVPSLLRAFKIDVDMVAPFHDQTIEWTSPRLYILFIQNISVAVAFYGLLSFYHGTEKDLEWCEPWPKFLCIKAVVFATFWQSVGIQILGSMNLLDDKAGQQIQNLLICIEMLVASLAHYYIFPYHEWQKDYQRRSQHEKAASSSKGISLRDPFAFKDFGKDVKSLVTPWEHSYSAIIDETQHHGEYQSVPLSDDVESPSICDSNSSVIGRIRDIETGDDGIECDSELPQMELTSLSSTQFACIDNDVSIHSAVPAAVTTSHPGERTSSSGDVCSGGDNNAIYSIDG
jgi:hypothetical protein